MFDEVPDVDSTPERTIVDLRGHGPIVTVGRYRHLAAKEALEPQRHRSWVVIVIPLKAHLDVLVDGRRWEVGPSQVMRIAPGQTYVTGATGQPRGQLVWLIGHVGGGGDPLNRALSSLAGAGPAVWQAPDQATASFQAALDDPGDTGWSPRRGGDYSADSPSSTSCRPVIAVRECRVERSSPVFVPR